MKILILVTFLFSLSSFAKMRVMTFNTTCSICNKKTWDKWRKRKHWILDTIKRADPDLISMQEVLLGSQLRFFKKRLKDYKMISFRRLLIFRYADPALFIKKGKFDVLATNGFWLGPLWGKFSFGWRIGLPRRVQHVLLRDKQTDREFYFVGSHFDNAQPNKTKAAKMFVKRYGKTDLPVLFAADTNLRPHDEGYTTLMSLFNDSYDYAEKVSFIRNSNTDAHDSCNLSKGREFPACRVDHILTSKSHSWRVYNWTVDQYKYGKRNKFTSDHRAFYADLELN